MSSNSDPKRSPAVLFSRPAVAARERDYVLAALESRGLQAGGVFTQRCETAIAQATGTANALLTHSCTAALETASLLLGIGPGDEVLMPSFAFASLANAVILRGATPVFVDIRPDTFNLDEKCLEEAITSATKAIYVVHYAGVVAEMDAINDLARKRGLKVLEDAAQAYLATYRDRPAGGLSDLGCFSFHETKNVISGEGGALVGDDATLAARALILADKGTNRRAFAKGELNRYTWVDVGFSLGPGELTAALLLAQLEVAAMLTAQRLALWHRYYDAFAALEQRGVARRPMVPAHCGHNGHIFALLLADAQRRDALMAALKADEIMATFHFVPLHSAPAGLRYGRTAGPLPHTDDVAARLLRLPLHADMGTDAVDRVIARVRYHLEL